MEATIMENQMEKKMENEMETDVMYGLYWGILPEGQLSVQAFDLKSITKHGSGANICKIGSLSHNSNWVAIH